MMICEGKVFDGLNELSGSVDGRRKTQVNHHSSGRSGRGEDGSSCEEEQSQIGRNRTTVKAPGGTVGHVPTTTDGQGGGELRWVRWKTAVCLGSCHHMNRKARYCPSASSLTSMTLWIKNHFPVIRPMMVPNGKCCCMASVVGFGEGRRREQGSHRVKIRKSLTLDFPITKLENLPDKTTFVIEK
jgi:hypothetical protein